MSHRRLDVLLITPPRSHRAERWRHGAEMAPLGVACLAGELEAAGLAVAILDCHAGRIGFGRLALRLAELRPRVVGLSFATEDRFEAFRCAAVAKRVDPSAIVVAGGPHVSGAAGDTLAHVPAIDAVVRGEGEAALVAIARGRDWAAIGGLSYRRGDRRARAAGGPDGVSGARWSGGVGGAGRTGGTGDSSAGAAPPAQHRTADLGATDRITVLRQYTSPAAPAAPAAPTDTAIPPAPAPDDAAENHVNSPPIEAFEAGRSADRITVLRQYSASGPAAEGGGTARGARRDEGGGGEAEAVGSAGSSVEADIVHNPPADPFDLDRLALPALHLLDANRYRFTMRGRDGRLVPAANVMTSRGCPFNCPYCTTPGMFGRHYRFVSLERTAEMLDQAERLFGAGGFWFFDDTFTVSHDRVEALCRHLADRPGRPSWFCEVRAETISRELLATMARAGCTEVGIGVETGSRRLAAAMGRAAALDRTPAVAEWCRELGILLHPFFICSLPDETADDLDATYRLAESLAAMGHRPTVGVLRIYPGTRYERLARERGLLPADFSWSSAAAQAGCAMPALHGAAPLWIEPGRWKDVARFLARWSRLQPISLPRRALKALRSIRSAGDLARTWRLGQAYFREMFARGVR